MVEISRDKQNVIAARGWKNVSFALAAVLAIDLLFRLSSISTGQCTISFGTYRGHEYRHPQETVGNPSCLLESKWMKVQQHSVKLTGQSVINDWLWIDYHDRINVLVEDEAQPERRFLVFEQTKYALEGRVSMAVVGGIVEPGEDAEVAARREVAEEMGGMHCDEFHFLGRFRTDVNRGMGWVNSFLATHCSRSDEKSRTKGLAIADKGEEVGTADTERQDMKSITLHDLREAATNGQFLEVQWSNTVSLALLHPELMA